MSYKPMSESVLLKNGKCCGSGCLKCPYIPKHTKGSTKGPPDYKEKCIMKAEEWKMECQDCQAEVKVEDLTKVTLKKGKSYHTSLLYDCPKCWGQWDLEAGVPREVWIEVKSSDKIIDLDELNKMIDRQTVGTKIL